MPSLNGFDIIAQVYDTMDRIAFGYSAKRAQVHFIQEIPPDSKILILGGGTGWILTKLLEAAPSLKIWYIDASQKMIQLAREKTKGASNIHFIHGTENDIPPEIKFDVVITYFFLDLFSDASLSQVIRKISESIKIDSVWLAADFIDQKKWWQKLMLRTMYTTIRLICKIEAHQLPDWQGDLARAGFQKSKSKSFFRGFIESTVFKAFKSSGFQNPTASFPR